MKALSVNATTILRHLMTGAIDGLPAIREPGNARKLDRNPAYMYLCVEMIAPGYVSLAHYGLQNGDMIRDPDVVFWDAPGLGWLPVSYRNDYAGFDATYVEAGSEMGLPLVVRDAQGQRGLAEFCETWLVNIVEQQNIEFPKQEV